ncbi:MAG: RNA polymerase sigma-54 factor, partial [Lactobacillus sp.]|nr:RNA polymerase sigma-54 factor [Lactobacillus sp.]
MTRLQKMVLKPKEQLVSRLFLSPKLRQNLTVLSYSTHDLIKAMKELSASDPFVFLREPQSDAMQNLEWLRAPEGENLVDHLLMQVDLSDWHDWEKRAVKMLIYHLDEDGYLRVSLTKIIERSEFSLENLTRAKKLLQSLDP